MEGKEIERAIEECEFFSELNREEIRNIAKICHFHQFNIGEFVFRQKDFGEHLYIIAQGQVVLERTMNLGNRKGSISIARLGKGRLMGCWSTLLGESHHLMSSACCEKVSKIVALKGSDLRKMMLENKEIGFRLMERLCFVLRDRIQAAYGALERV